MNTIPLITISKDRRYLHIIHDQVKGEAKYFYYDETTDDYVRIPKDKLKYLDLGFEEGEEL